MALVPSSGVLEGDAGADKHVLAQMMTHELKPDRHAGLRDAGRDAGIRSKLGIAVLVC